MVEIGPYYTIGLKYQIYNQASREFHLDVFPKLWLLNLDIHRFLDVAVATLHTPLWLAVSGFTVYHATNIKLHYMARQIDLNANNVETF